MGGRAVQPEHNATPNLTQIKGLGRSWSWEDYKQVCDVNGTQLEL